MTENYLIDKVVVFQAQDEEYGLPIQFVVSIEKLQPLTAVPNMPEYMNGVTTVRGEITPILDAGKILYGNKTEDTDQTRMIILNTEGLSFGLIVDDAKEILDIPANSVQPLNMIASLQTSYLMGVANLDGRLLTLIDPTKLIHTLEEMDEVKKQLK
ncbi:chemotaxis protein CheW [Bacillus pinisoli]|uniref:chemotaxis protein CheW n=1 Tax=Bacillus pinisoli TaxID=2901866 RepID=UPI001FF13280|nr:chemotaxis protein CheW [Bacillus pinisoli]